MRSRQTDGLRTGGQAFDPVTHVCAKCEMTRKQFLDAGKPKCAIPKAGDLARSAQRHQRLFSRGVVVAAIRRRRRRETNVIVELMHVGGPELASEPEPDHTHGKKSGKPENNSLTGHD